LSGVGVVEIQRFMIYCSDHMMSTGVYNIKLYMKKLYQFLAAGGYSSEAYEGLFNFKVSRESRLYPAASPEEVAAILDVIDRRLLSGKRDYAMVLLGVVTGLRACDIARLKLTDIDWQKVEIKIVQAKTGVSLALPLTADIGEAIQDYIIHGRKKTDCDALFLSLHCPYHGFKNGDGIRYLFDRYTRRAKLPRNAYDGKGFHSLRRAVGKNLVAAGVPVESVAQIVGDNKVDSVKKYIALDSHHLKECALGFSGIGKGARA
jgi:integrase